MPNGCDKKALNNANHLSPSAYPPASVFLALPQSSRNSSSPDGEALVTDLGERLSLHLTDSLLGHLEFAGQFGKGPNLTVLQAESKPQYLLLSPLSNSSAHEPGVFARTPKWPHRTDPGPFGRQPYHSTVAPSSSDPTGCCKETGRWEILSMRSTWVGGRAPVGRPVRRWWEAVPSAG